MKDVFRPRFLPVLCQEHCLEWQAGSGPAEVQPLDENFSKGLPAWRGGFLATEKLSELQIIAPVVSDSFQTAMSFLKNKAPLSLPGCC